MLQTNLSTRPFYNIRAVRLSLVIAAVLVTALTIVSIGRAIALSSSEDQLSARATEAMADAERMRADAARIRGKVNQEELAQLTVATTEANTVIEQRAFSWSRLLTEIEAALPDDVRVTRVEPRVDRHAAIIVAISVEAQEVEDYAAFMDALERGGRFRDVLPKSESHNDDVIEVVIEGQYTAEKAGPESKTSAPAGGRAQREQ